MSEILRDAGYVVAAFGTALQALEDVNGPKPIDLMVVDYAMPDMRGDEFAAQVPVPLGLRLCQPIARPALDRADRLPEDISSGERGGSQVQLARGNGSTLKTVLASSIGATDESTAAFTHHAEIIERDDAANVW